jgi:N-methylhydantoinase B
LEGGGEAHAGKCQVIHPDGKVENLPSKITTVIEKGARLISTTPGGGGRGNPLDRPAEWVLKDVLDDLICRDTALTAYGVVLRPDLTLDEQATRQKRSTMKA